MQARPGLGPSDFKKIRSSGLYHYVDKTRWIAEVLQRPSEVVLVPRPRRFGKTLNLSTLRYFLGNDTEGSAELFEGLEIAAAPAPILEMQGAFPVVFLTLKDVKQPEFDRCMEGVRLVLASACQDHDYLEESSALTASEKKVFADLLTGNAGDQVTSSALALLTRWLAKHHGENAVVLIDEYDAPIESGYLHGYYDEVVGLLRTLLSSGLKDNRFLFKAVLTGVRRVSKESLFSGLNNVEVCSLLSPAFPGAFGFTEDEVAEILAAAGLADRMDDVRDWYNGYFYNGVLVYNPWSVLTFALDGRLGPHWAAPSSEELLRKLLVLGRVDMDEELATLVQGGSIDRSIDEHVDLRSLDTSPEVVWSFLLFAGYLNGVPLDETWSEQRVRLSLPNREVRSTLTGLHAKWIAARPEAHRRLEALIAAMLEGRADELERLLGELVLDVLSFHDVGASSSERVYHAFVVGLMAWLEPTHRVRSERESGLGRSDVLVLPTEPGGAGAVLEFKKVDGDSGQAFETALASAVAQIEDRAYPAEVRASGAREVHAYAIAFRGKEVRVRAAPAGA